MKIVVTGGAGFIGSRLVAALLTKGMDVVVIDNLDSGKKENVPVQAIFYKTDVQSLDMFSLLQKEKPDMIFHLAALKSVDISLSDPIGFAKSNVLGSLNILDYADRLGIKKIVFTSTAAVYGNDFYSETQYEEQPLNPLSPYGCSKLAVENYMNYYNKAKGMQGIVLRFANVYGPGGKTDYPGVVNIFVEKVLKQETVIINGDGNQTRDFVSTDDIVSICVLLATTEYKNKTGPEFIFNVSTGKASSVNEVLETIVKLTKRTPNVIYKKEAYTGQEKSTLSP